MCFDSYFLYFSYSTFICLLFFFVQKIQSVYKQNKKRATSGLIAKLRATDNRRGVKVTKAERVYLVIKLLYKICMMYIIYY